MHDDIYALIREDRTKEARSVIDQARAADNSFPELDLYEALCLYEEKEDLKCINLLTAFVHNNPLHQKRDYAIFTAAISFMNLEMPGEALQLLELIPDSYPDKETSVKEARNTIEKQSQGKELFRILKSTAEPGAAANASRL
jgi:outer membrane protein assembly factor BamD (BamD/ComL family)